MVRVDFSEEVTGGASDVMLVGPQAFAYNKDLLNVTFLSRKRSSWGH